MQQQAMQVLSSFLVAEATLGEALPRLAEVSARAAVVSTDQHSEAAQEQGIMSTLSTPLVVGDRGIGALNLYASKPHAFDDDDSASVSLLAARMAIVVASAGAYWDAYDLSRQLNEAMGTRSTIEQATGVRMAQSGVNAVSAFRAAAQGVAAGERHGP